jgi:hypothetical protein
LERRDVEKAIKELWRERFAGTDTASSGVTVVVVCVGSWPFFVCVCEPKKKRGLDYGGAKEGKRRKGSVCVEWGVEGRCLD